MAVTVSIIDDKSILIDRIGMITKEQLITAYQQVLTMEVDYIVIDNSNMMYSVESIYNDDVRPFVQEVLQREQLKKVIVILSEVDELRSRVKGAFQEFSVFHKLIFAETIYSAKGILADLQT